MPKLVGSKGKTHVVWTPVFPRVVQQSRRLVAFQAPTTVGGWLGTSGGTALAGQTVRVLTAPDNGLEQFSQAAVAISRADGTWTASLPPGPSRLVEAVYDGSSATEPATSAYARVIVPSRVLLHIEPRRVPWGGTIHIAGRVLGGYIPGARQQLLRLRIGAEGISTTVGIPDITPDGRFTTSFTFNPGQGVVDYWFSVSTLREADYPYAPGSSPRVGVAVGPGTR